MLRTLLLSAAAGLLPAPAAAQDSLVAPVPFGTPGAEVAAILERRELRVLARGAGRDVHAATGDRQVQAVAVLAGDALVGLIYYHPETPVLGAAEVFARAVEEAERRHGAPTCRRSGWAVWPVEGGVLEVRHRGPNGDGAPGAEVRYLSPGYEAELARREAARREARAQRPASGPRLLGVPASDAAAEPPAGEDAAPDPAATPEEAVRHLCTR
jgi:hypothetical protein